MENWRWGSEQFRRLLKIHVAMKGQHCATPSPTGITQNKLAGQSRKMSVGFQTISQIIENPCDR